MLNLKRMIGMVLVGAVIISCQDDTADLNQLEDVTVEAINADQLPSASITYIEDSFSGELVVTAYRVTSEEVSYEAFLTNNMNLVFDADGAIAGFGEEGSVVGCGGSRRHGRRGHRGDSSSANRPDRTEITIDDLPTSAVDYLDANYPDSTIKVIMEIAKDTGTEYHVLMENVGALIFDADGNFVELKERRSGGCGNFTEVAIEDLSSSITDYLTANYPDNEILRARTGTRNDVVETHVVVDTVGVLIFDESENFIELKTCGMDG